MMQKSLSFTDMRQRINKVASSSSHTLHPADNVEKVEGTSWGIRAVKPQLSVGIDGKPRALQDAVILASYQSSVISYWLKSARPTSTQEPKTSGSIRGSIFVEEARLHVYQDSAYRPRRKLLEPKWSRKINFRPVATLLAKDSTSYGLSRSQRIF